MEHGTRRSHAWYSTRCEALHSLCGPARQRDRCREHCRTQCQAARAARSILGPLCAQQYWPSGCKYRAWRSLLVHALSRQHKQSIEWSINGQE